MSEHVVRIENGIKTFRSREGEIPVLRRVDLTVAQGEAVAITGISGSGKSTLLKILGLFQPLDSGRFEFLGRDVRRLRDGQGSALRAAALSFVFQEPNLLPHLRAVQNVMYAGAFAGVPRHRRRAEAISALDAVGLSHRRDARPGTLSGGESQRVGIARALVKRPKVVLADEPTGSLDSRTASSVLDLLFGVVGELDAALIVVTHDPAVAERCDRRLELVDGVLLERTT